MIIDYQIRIENGGVSITQHVDATTSSGSAQPQPAARTLTLLGNSFGASKAAAAARAAGQGGNAGDQPGPGGNAGSKLGLGGNAGDQPGPGGDGNTQGQIVVFGPVVIDSAGLVHKCLTEQPSKEHGEK